MLKKIIGKLLYATLGALLPRSTARFGGKLGKSFRGFCAGLMFIKTGSNVNLEKHAVTSTRVTIGSNSGIGENCYIQGAVTIGDNVMMAKNVKIFTTNHETRRTDIPMCEQGSQPERPVTIGSDVWICDSVIICPGSKIGSGVILGAGAVVRGEIPDYAVVAGNPAQVIRYRGQKNE